MASKTNFPLLISILIFISLIYTLVYFVYYYIENDLNIKNHYKTKALYGLYILITIIIVILSLYILIKNIGKSIENSMRF
jgi:hypothetical protein